MNFAILIYWPFSQQEGQQLSKVVCEGDGTHRMDDAWSIVCKAALSNHGLNWVPRLLFSNNAS